jgi:general secretion pathway protein G
MSNRGGFTLIELILVTVIISILAGTVVVSFQGRSQQAREARAKTDIVAYMDAVELYAIDHNDKYPGSLNELTSGETRYVRKLENDPWGQPYIYQPSPQLVKISSAGHDGVAGTEDDIKGWE